MRMAVALSSRGRRPDTAPAMRLTAQAQGEQRAPYPGRGQNRRQRRRCPPRLRAVSAKTAPSNRSVKRISHLGAGVAAMCHGHSRRPFSSRALTKAATIPIARSCPSVVRGLSPTRSASNGCAQRFSPSAPQRFKGQEKVLTKGGPNSSRNKIASLRRPPLTLRPFASLRVQATRGGLLSAAPRDTSWRWASGPRRKDEKDPRQWPRTAPSPPPSTKPAPPSPSRPPSTSAPTRASRKTSPKPSASSSPNTKPSAPSTRSPSSAWPRPSKAPSTTRRRPCTSSASSGPSSPQQLEPAASTPKRSVRPATPPPAPPTAATTNSEPRSASTAGRSAPASLQPTWRCRPSPSSPQPTAPSTATGTSPARTGKPTRPPLTPRSRRRPPPPRWEPSAADALRGGCPKGPRPPSLPGALRRPTVGAHSMTISFNPLKANGHLFTHLPELDDLEFSLSDADANAADVLDALG